MHAPNTLNWIRVGLFALPVYGLLTSWATLDPQPDQVEETEKWARYVGSNYYLVDHVLGTIGGATLAILGVFALGAYLATSRAGRLGLVAVVMTVLGSALFLPLAGISTFAVPEEGQAVLAGLEEFEALPDIFANTVAGLTGLVVILLGFVGHILVGVAVWRSGTLPRWTGALWAGANVLMYLSLVYGQTIGPASTPFTVPLGAVVLVISGAWIALTVLSRPSGAQAVGAAAAQPRVS